MVSVVTGHQEMNHFSLANKDWIVSMGMYKIATVYEVTPIYDIFCNESIHWFFR